MGHGPRDMETSARVTSAFFGRKELWELFEKRRDAFLKGYRQNIGILGAPLLGKTSLVRAFASKMQSFEQVIAIFFSCRPSDSFQWFSQRWMGELLLGFHRTLGQSPPANLQILIRSLKGVIPKTLKQMRLTKSLTMAHRHDQAYRELLALSGTLAEECRKKILLVLDNFDRLEELGLADCFIALGKEIMVQKETMYVVTTSHLNRGRAIFQEKLSLLFGNFEVIQMMPFRFDEAAQFMSERAPSSTWDDQVKRFLIRLTDGHPYYLACLLDRLARFAGDGRLLRAQIAQALEEELYQETGFLGQYFQSRLYRFADSRPWNRYGDVLLAISLGHKKLSQMIRFLHWKGREVKRILEGLLSSEAIEKHGSLFVIPDPLFRFWLAKVYYGRRVFFDSLHDSTRAGFLSCVEQGFEESAREDSLELPKQIEELFRRFRNDVVQLDQRRFVCSHFTEVVSRPNNGRVFPVTAKSDRTRWLCQVLRGQVLEEDVRVFLEDLKRLRGPVQKKLIVGLGGIDLNAKLLAQEAQIQYLDLRSLNLLLDIYDRPKVVV